MNVLLRAREEQLRMAAIVEIRGEMWRSGKRFRCNAFSGWLVCW